MSELKDTLFYTQKNMGETISDDERLLSDSYCEGYRWFLDRAKTEREAVTTAISLAESVGFVPFEQGMPLKPGDRIYKSIRGKAIMLAVIGKKSLAEGINIAGAHVDAPRLDLKQLPLYEDNEMAYLKTHYYGGLRKYQWVTIPMELHGVVVRKDGETVNVSIGGDETEPVIVITDLLPHLSAEQNKKTLGEAFTGEGMNLLVGSLPLKDDEGGDKVKLAVMKLLNEKYGIIEEDFLSAELEAVPAFDSRDVGLDRSLLGAYGHDDRVCAYAQLMAIMDTEEPERTAVCLLVDKEEIGSEGVAGMQSQAFECFIGDLCDTQGVKLSHCFENSFCISADVVNAFDPNYPEVSEKRNSAKVNYGLAICKYTGARGKSSTNDASAEVVARVRRLFAERGVVWQMAELGKVDQGGGGTIAKYMSNRNIDTVDAGVPVLSMHAPFEVVAKLDCYMTYKGMKALFGEK